MTLDEINDLIDEVQQIFASEAPVLEEELVDLAARLEDAVAQVTRRLKQVDLLLSKGLRSEAIELAERDPNLNDLITALDFPEFDAWNALLGQFEISPVRALPPDLAAELNDAYSASASVNNLLNRFRTQSLSRAALSARIDTLRRLAARDPDNPVWRNDLLDFEQARMAELKSQVEQAIRAADVEQLAVLDQELASDEWSVKVPAAIRKQTADAHRSLRRSTSRKEMETLGHQLSDAYAAFDLVTAKRLRQRFDALQQIVRVQPNDPLLDVAGPALDWIDEANKKQHNEAEYSQALENLELALEQESSLQELTTLYHHATRHEWSLPEQLEARLADRMETLQTQAARRRTIVVIASTAAGLAVVAAVLLFVRQIGIRSEIDGHVAQLTTLLSEANKTGVLEPLTGYFQRVDQGRVAVSTAPEIQGLRQQLENLQISEAGRLTQIAELTGTADRIALSASRIEQLSAAEEALQKADILAKNATERSGIIAIQSHVQQKQADLQNQIDVAFGKDLEQVTSQSANLPPDRLDGYAEVLNQVTELLNRPGVSPELKTSVDALQVKLINQRSMISRNLEIAQELSAITDSVDKLVEFETRLRSAASTNAGTQRAKDFERVLNEEQKLYRGALQWNTLRRKLLVINARTMRPAEAQLLVNDINQFLKDSGPYPGPTHLDSRIAVLKSIASRKTGSDGTMLDSLKALFAARTISGAYLITTTDNEFYYTPDVPESAGSLYKFDYFTTTTGTQTTSRTLGRQKVGRGTSEAKEDDWLSPQTQLWRSILPQLNNEAPDFEQDLVQITEQVINAERVDPILRFLLLEKLLKLGSENSEFVRVRADKVLKSIDEAGVSRLTNWVVYGDKRAEKDRSNAEFFFKSRSSEILESLKLVMVDRAELEQRTLGPPVQWVGWLHKDLDGRWVVSLPSVPVSAEGSQLFVIAQDSSQGMVRMLDVATFPDLDTTKVLVPNVDPTWPEGRPVFRVLDGS